MTDEQTNKAPIRAALILFALLLSASAQPQTITGRVVGVVDGDTLDVLDARKRTIRIRLQGVDSPESSQDFGQRAKQSLSDLVFGKTVTVISAKRDRYERPLGKVTLDGKNINLEQVRLGFAWFHRHYAKELRPEDATAYDKAEAQARNEKRGLWAGASPVPPWDFRRGKTTKASGAKLTTPATGPIIGNRNSRIYHLSNCPDYNRVAEKNRVSFKSEAEAKVAKYRKARNCPQ